MKITDEFLVKGYYRNYDGMHLLKHALHNTCPDMMKMCIRDSLYGAYGKEHVKCLLASLAVSQSRHTAVARVESQILELVALIYEDVVDAHLLEIHHVVRA